MKTAAAGTDADADRWASAMLAFRPQVWIQACANGSGALGPWGSRLSYAAVPQA